MKLMLFPFGTCSIHSFNTCRFKVNRNSVTVISSSCAATFSEQQFSALTTPRLCPHPFASHFSSTSPQIEASYISLCGRGVEVSQSGEPVALGGERSEKKERAGGSLSHLFYPSWINPPPRRRGIKFISRTFTL